MKTDSKKMTFKEVCDELGIGKYTDRILNSNSRGEMFHIYDYYIFLKTARGNELFKKMFPTMFEFSVEFAEKKWSRPDSVFQHMPKMIEKYISVICEMNRNVKQ